MIMPHYTRLLSIAFLATGMVVLFKGSTANISKCDMSVQSEYSQHYHISKVLPPRLQQQRCRQTL